jgi:hypothetical protein
MQDGGIVAGTNRNLEVHVRDTYGLRQSSTVNPGIHEK